MVDPDRKRVASSIQAPGPNGLGYRLAGSPVSCCQLDAHAGTISVPMCTSACRS